MCGFVGIVNYKKDISNYKWAFNHENRILEAISWYNINVFEKDLDAQIVP